MTLEREINVGQADFARAFGAAAESMLNEHTARFTAYIGPPRPPRGVQSARDVPLPAKQQPRVRWIGRAMGRLRGRRG